MNFKRGIYTSPKFQQQVTGIKSSLWEAARPYILYFQIQLFSITGLEGPMGYQMVAIFRYYSITHFLFMMSLPVQKCAFSAFISRVNQNVTKTWQKRDSLCAWLIGLSPFSNQAEINVIFL